MKIQGYRLIYKNKMEFSIISSDSDESDLEVLAQLSDWDTDSDTEEI